MSGVAPKRKLGEVLDFVNLMTYDYNGAWSMQTGHLAPRHPPLHLESPAVRVYAGGASFAARNAQDFALWRGANARIEARFEGSPALRAALDALRGLQVRASARCAPEFTADGYPAHGLRCLFNDQACNYECLDRVFQDDEGPIPSLGVG